MAPQARKSTQRERLLRGMVQVTNRRGYASANVSAVIGEAGVSRPTFYDYFADRDQCFRAAIEDIQDELLATLEEALRSHPAGDASSVAVGTFIAYAGSAPGRARFLMGESMAGGAGALDARDRAIATIAEAIRRSERGAGDAARLPDLDASVLTGSVFRMIATRLRRGEAAISRLTEDLLGWLAAYERPSGERRWQTLSPGLVPARSQHVPDVPIQQMPQVFPPGRPRMSEEEIAENHRRRILYAAARLAEEKGYTATTVADITKLARVDGRVFYRLFSDKQEAFSAVHELGFQQVMDVTAKAFFAGRSWPERSWEGGRALTQLLQENPLVANVGFVEAYAVGPVAVQRIEDSHTAFMFFLQEGLLHASHAGAPSRTAMEAIISSIFEIIYLQARHAGEPQIAAMLAHIEHMWLAPFLGVRESDAFIDLQIEANTLGVPTGEG